MKKIIITVVKLNGRLYFLFEYGGKKIYFFELSALANYFNGYSANTILVLRNKKDFDKGNVRYAGTHAGQEWFYGFEKIIPKNDQVKYLSSSPPTTDTLKVSYFKEGDILEIESEIMEIQFFVALSALTWLKKDTDESEQLEKLEKEKEEEIESKHGKNEKVRTMLLRRLWNKNAKIRSERIEKRKEMLVVIENG